MAVVRFTQSSATQPTAAWHAALVLLIVLLVFVFVLVFILCFVLVRVFILVIGFAALGREDTGGQLLRLGGLRWRLFLFDDAVLFTTCVQRLSSSRNMPSLRLVWMVESMR